MARIGFDEKTQVFDTPAQKEPDPDFPTCPFPNPEEGLPVLKWAIDAANDNQCHLIIANDPDADRVQIAERQTE